jgi:haloalkane dehalogenase
VTLRTPDDRFSALTDYPFEPHFAEWEGMRLHYLDEGVGPAVVLFHGEPTWSYLYRNVIPPLVEAGFRVIAPDYPGFGRSDKPTDPAFYSYDRMTQAMVDLCDSLDLQDATAVVQDWGGPIGLRTAVERPGRFRRLVIMNTGLFTGQGRVTPAFEAWRAFVEKTPDLPIEFILQNASESDWGSDVLAGYSAPFPTAEHKIGAWRMPLIVPLTADDPGAAEMITVREALATWSDPVLVLFADQDPIFTTRVGERFADTIPGAEPLELIPGAGHLLQEDDPEAVAAAIVGFLNRT